MRATYPLLRIWVKSPSLRGADILIVGECVGELDKPAYHRLSKGKVVLTFCPEADPVSSALGKLSSIIRSSAPRSISLLTVEGSPHCLTLHAALNEALYVTKCAIPTEHYVLVGDEAVRISPDSVRVARYLHLVDRLVRER
ncbi:TPA: 4Fe-4S ferredoxin, partial [Candidatus Bathyarchaeota archaeon]|nr:4Fe-4S ferredoxin [Candidatus Bathyarchaeota archaeon]